MARSWEASRARCFPSHCAAILDPLLVTVHLAHRIREAIEEAYHRPRPKVGASGKIEEADETLVGPKHRLSGNDGTGKEREGVTMAIEVAKIELKSVQDASGLVAAIRAGQFSPDRVVAVI